MDMFENIMKNDKFLESIVVFYIISMSPNLNLLTSERLNEEIKNNRYLQHLIGFLTICYIISTLDVIEGDKKNAKLLFASVIAHMFILISSKMDSKSGIILMISFAIYYIFIKKSNSEELKLNEDKSLNKKEKEKIKKSKRRMTYGFTILMSIIMFYSCFKYMGKKHVQYGGGFNLDKFIFDKRN